MPGAALHSLHPGNNKRLISAKPNRAKVQLPQHPFAQPSHPCAHLSPHTASSRPATASGGAKKKATAAPRGRPKGLRSALCWHPRRALQTAMQPPHPTLPGTMQHAVQVQCSAAAGRCSRAGWRPRRRGRQAGHRAARFSYPFSRQRDASSQPAALRQPCRSALASLRHLQEGVEDERDVQAGGTFRRQHGGGGGAGVAPTALIPAAPPKQTATVTHGERRARPACLRFKRHPRRAAQRPRGSRVCLKTTLCRCKRLGVRSSPPAAPAGSDTLRLFTLAAQRGQQGVQRVASGAAKRGTQAAARSNRVGSGGTAQRRVCSLRPPAGILPALLCTHVRIDAVMLVTMNCALNKLRKGE